MSVELGIVAVAPSATIAKQASEAWNANHEKLAALGANNDLRLAAIIGQCGHESARFRVRYENLNYSASGLLRVFRKYFSSTAQANKYARQPEKIANRVYANRMSNGNEASGDGWRYRGRGYLQLTGRANYRNTGKALGLPLEDNPEMAAEPATAWLIAVHYMATRKRSGKSLLHWADVPDIVMVTKGINGGTHGLPDRKIQTAHALAGLNGTISTAHWQQLLHDSGFDPGPIDGLDGPKTRNAMAQAEAKFGKTGNDLAKALRDAA